MKITDALELAYKNGYVKGYKDAMAESIRIIQNTTTKQPQEANNNDDTRIEDHN